MDRSLSYNAAATMARPSSPRSTVPCPRRLPAPSQRKCMHGYWIPIPQAWRRAAFRRDPSLYPLSFIPYPLSLIPYPLSLSLIPIPHPYPYSCSYSYPSSLILIPYPLSLIPYPLSLSLIPIPHPYPSSLSLFLSLILSLSLIPHPLSFSSF